MTTDMMSVIQSLVPGAKCLIWENDIDRIVWNDERPMPSRAEIEAAIPSVEAAQAAAAQMAYLQSLDDSMHAYIASRYNQSWQAYLQMMYADPDSSEARKAACKSAGNWVKSIVEGYYKAMVLRVLAGEILSAEDTDWAAQFDASDPGINLLTLPE